MLAAKAPATGDTRRWLAITAQNVSASLKLPGVQASVVNLALDINRAAGTLAGQPAPQALNWGAAIDTDETGAFTATGVPGITQTQDKLAVSGDLVGLDVLGLLTGAAHFDLQRDIVDLDLDHNGTIDVQDATLVTFTVDLNGADKFLQVGTDTFGLRINDGTINIAAISAKAPASPATDTRSWLAIQATGLSAVVALPAGMTAGVTGVKIEINRASGQADDGVAATPVVLAAPLDWTNAVDKQETDTTFHADTLAVTLTSDRLAVAGTLTNLNIADFLKGGADFDLTKSTVAVDLPGGTLGEIASADMLTFGLQNLNLTVGDASGPHFSITGGTLALASIKPSAPAAGDTRSWLALKGSVTASFEGVPNLTLTASNLAVEINTASGAAGGVDAAALNWKTALNLDRNAAFGEATDQVTILGTAIDLEGKLTRVSGVATIDIFGFVGGGVAFSFSQDTANVDTDGNGTFDLTGATRTTLGLRILPGQGFHIGAGGVGFNLQSGRLALAIIKPAAASDTRSWMALSASIGEGTFFGIPGLEMTVHELGVELNKGTNKPASGSATEIAGLDWTKAFAGKPAGITIDVADADGNVVTLPIGFTASVMRVKGDVSIDVFGFVTGHVGFMLETLAKNVDSDGNGTFDLTNASVTTISLSVISAGPGQPGLFIGVPGGVGFTVGAGTLAIATVKPAGTTDSRTWTAIKGHLSQAAFVGVPGITLEATDLQVDINQFKADAGVTINALDWTKAFGTSVAARLTAGGETFDAVDGHIRASGNAHVNLFDFVDGTVSFGFETSTVNVTLPGGAPGLTNAKLTTIYLGITSLFVGAAGIGFRFSSTNTGGIGIAMLKPADASDQRSWMAVRASGLSATFEGFDTATLDVSARNVSIEINTSSGGANPPAPLDWAAALGAAPQAKGPAGTTPVAINLAGPALKVAGALRLNLAGFVMVSGSFAFEKGDDIFVTPSGTTGTVKATPLTLGIHDASIFAASARRTPTTTACSRAPRRDATGVGVFLEHVEVGLAMFKQVVPAGQPAKSWLALTASGSAPRSSASTASCSTARSPSRSTASRTRATRTRPPRSTSRACPAASSPSRPARPCGSTPAPTVDLRFTGPIIRATGSVVIALDSFAYVGGDFAFEKKPAVDATLSNSTTHGMADLLTVGVSNARAFFGIGGPYFQPGTTAVQADGAMGLVVTNMTMALALLKPTAGSALATNNKSFLALSATGNVELVGLTGITAALRNLSLEINSASPQAGKTATPIDFTKLPGGKLNVPTGPSSSRDIAFTGPVFAASGMVDLRIDEFVRVTGGVSFQKGVPLTNQPLSDGSTASLTAMLIGASNVNVFVGTGYTDANNDGVVDDAGGAVGLKLSGVNLALALMKPDPPASNPTQRITRSYLALKASAHTIALIGLDGVTVSATNLNVEINRASDSAPGAPATLPVVNFSTKKLTITTGPAVGGNPAPSEELSFATPLLRASGRVTLGIAGVDVAADIAYEQQTRNGVQVSKILIGDIFLDLGALTLSSGTAAQRANPGIDVANGAILITPDGIAAQLSLQNFSFAAGDTSSFGVRLTVPVVTLAINTIQAPVKETFSYGASTPVQLDLERGPYLRITVGSVATPAELKVYIAGTETKLSGAFQFERVALGTGPNPPTQIRIAAANVTASFTDSVFGHVSLTNGNGAFLIQPVVGGVAASGGVVGVMNGHFEVELSSLIDAESDVSLGINTTNADVLNETVVVGGQTISIAVNKQTFALSLRKLAVSFGDFLSLTGDFTYSAQNTDGAGGNDKFIYGARNVEIFLGAGPYRLDDGSVNPDAIGILVTNATVGVVKFLNDESDQNDDTFAIYAFGEAERRRHPAADPRAARCACWSTTPATVVTDVDHDAGRTTARGSSDRCRSRRRRTPGDVRDRRQRAGRARRGRAAHDQRRRHLHRQGAMTLHARRRAAASTSTSRTASSRSTSRTTTAAAGGLRAQRRARFAFGGGLGFQLQDLRVNGFAIARRRRSCTIDADADDAAPADADLASPFAGSDRRRIERPQRPALHRRRHRP